MCFNSSKSTHGQLMTWLNTRNEDKLEQRWLSEHTPHGTPPSPRWQCTATRCMQQTRPFRRCRGVMGTPKPVLSLVTLTFDLDIQARPNEEATRLPCELGANPFSGSRDIWGTNKKQTRMWADAQRDGRHAEYRWRPLLNAAKFGWRPLLECRAVTLPRCETHWNL